MFGKQQRHAFAHDKLLFRVAVCSTTRWSRVPAAELKPGTSLYHLLDSMLHDHITAVAAAPRRATWQLLWRRATSRGRELRQVP